MYPFFVLKRFSLVSIKITIQTPITVPKTNSSAYKLFLSASQSSLVLELIFLLTVPISMSPLDFNLFDTSCIEVFQTATVRNIARHCKGNGLMKTSALSANQFP